VLSCWVSSPPTPKFGGRNLQHVPSCCHCGPHARSWIVEVLHWESLVMVLCCLMLEMVGCYLHTHHLYLFMQHSMTVRNFCSFCALLLWMDYRDCRWEKEVLSATLVFSSHRQTVPGTG